MDRMTAEAERFCRAIKNLNDWVGLVQHHTKYEQYKDALFCVEVLRDRVGWLEEDIRKLQERGISND